MDVRSIFTSNLLISLAIVIELGHALDAKKDLSKTLNNKTSHSDQNSHEAFHSKNDSYLLPSNTTIVNFKDPKHNISTTYNNTLKHHSQSHVLNESSTPALPVKHVQVVAEGGIGMKTFKHTNQLNESMKDPLTNISTSIKVHNNITTIKPYLEESEKPLHKRIHGRPGVSEFSSPTVVSNYNKSLVINSTTNSPTTKLVVKKKKPLFTVATGDEETKESESFIESPTTGRDYVLPIVLIILSLPILFYIIKLIYRRGTEFTERQQYHRMYLIDGMYNSSWSLFGT